MESVPTFEAPPNPAQESVGSVSQTDRFNPGKDLCLELRVPKFSSPSTLYIPCSIFYILMISIYIAVYRAVVSSLTRVSLSRHANTNEITAPKRHIRNMVLYPIGM